MLPNQDAQKNTSTTMGVRRPCFRSNEVNCRTCLHSTPVEGGWQCERHEKTLSEADQRIGCEQHLYLPPLVPAVQVDAGDDWVDYEFPSGQRWRDVGLNKNTDTQTQTNPQMQTELQP